MTNRSKSRHLVKMEKSYSYTLLDNKHRFLYRCTSLVCTPIIKRINLDCWTSHSFHVYEQRRLGYLLLFNHIFKLKFIMVILAPSRYIEFINCVQNTRKQVNKNKLSNVQNYQNIILHPITTRNFPTTANFRQINITSFTPTNDQFTLCLKFLKQDANYYHCKYGN